MPESININVSAGGSGGGGSDDFRQMSQEVRKMRETLSLMSSSNSPFNRDLYNTLAQAVRPELGGLGKAGKTPFAGSGSLMNAADLIRAVRESGGDSGFARTKLQEINPGLESQLRGGKLFERAAEKILRRIEETATGVHDTEAIRGRIRHDRRAEGAASLAGNESGNPTVDAFRFKDVSGNIADLKKAIGDLNSEIINKLDTRKFSVIATNLGKAAEKAVLLKDAISALKADINTLANGDMAVKIKTKVEVEIASRENKRVGDSLEGVSKALNRIDAKIAAGIKAAFKDIKLNIPKGSGDTSDSGSRPPKAPKPDHTPPPPPPPKRSKAVEDFVVPGAPVPRPAAQAQPQPVEKKLSAREIQTLQIAAQVKKEAQADPFARISGKDILAALSRNLPEDKQSKKQGILDVKDVAISLGLVNYNLKEFADRLAKFLRAAEIGNKPIVKGEGKQIHGAQIGDLKELDEISRLSSFNKLKFSLPTHQYSASDIASYGRDIIGGKPARLLNQGTFSGRAPNNQDLNELARQLHNEFVKGDSANKNVLASLERKFNALYGQLQRTSVPPEDLAFAANVKPITGQRAARHATDQEFQNILFTAQNQISRGSGGGGQLNLDTILRQAQLHQIQVNPNTRDIRTGDLVLTREQEDKARQAIALYIKRRLQQAFAQEVKALEAQGYTKPQAEKLADQRVPNSTSFNFNLRDPSSGLRIAPKRQIVHRDGPDEVQNIASAGTTADRFGSQVQNAFRRVTLYATAASSVYAVATAFRTGIDAIVQTDKRMAELNFLMNSVRSNMTDLRKEAFAVSKEFGYSIQDTTDAMVVFAQQGRSQIETIKLVTASLALANQTTLSTTASTEAITAAMATFNLRAEDSMRIVDAWANAANKSAVSAEVLADALKKSGAAASTVGLSFDELNGLIAAVNESTRKSGQEIGTTLKYLFQNINSADTVKTLENLGIAVYSTRGQLRPFLDILGDVRDRMISLSDEQRRGVLVQLASVRHYSDLTVLLKDFDKVQRLARDSADSFGTSQKNNQIVMQTLSKNFTNLKTSFQDFATDLGAEGVSSAFEIIAGAARVAVEGLDALPDVFKGVIATGTLLVGGLSLIGNTFYHLFGVALPSIADGFKVASAAQREFAALQKTTISDAEARIIAYSKESEQLQKLALEYGIVGDAQKRNLGSSINNLAAQNPKFVSRLGPEARAVVEETQAKSLNRRSSLIAQTAGFIVASGAGVAIGDYGRRRSEKFGGNDATSIGASTLGGALTGTAFGSFFGAPGAVAGGAFGGLVGFVSAMKDYKNSLEAALEINKKQLSNFKEQISAVEELKDELKKSADQEKTIFGTTRVSASGANFSISAREATNKTLLQLQNFSPNAEISKATFTGGKDQFGFPTTIFTDSLNNVADSNKALQGFLDKLNTTLEGIRLETFTSFLNKFDEDLNQAILSLNILQKNPGKISGNGFFNSISETTNKGSLYLADLFGASSKTKAGYQANILAAQIGKANPNIAGDDTLVLLAVQQAASERIKEINKMLVDGYKASLGRTTTGGIAFGAARDAFRRSTPAVIAGLSPELAADKALTGQIAIGDLSGLTGAQRKSILPGLKQQSDVFFSEALKANNLRGISGGIDTQKQLIAEQQLSKPFQNFGKDISAIVENLRSGDIVYGKNQANFITNAANGTFDVTTVKETADGLIQMSSSSKKTKDEMQKLIESFSEADRVIARTSESAKFLSGVIVDPVASTNEMNRVIGKITEQIQNMARQAEFSFSIKAGGDRFGRNPLNFLDATEQLGSFYGGALDKKGIGVSRVDTFSIDEQIKQAFKDATGQELFSGVGGQDLKSLSLDKNTDSLRSVDENLKALNKTLIDANFEAIQKANLNPSGILKQDIKTLRDSIALGGDPTKGVNKLIQNNAGIEKLFTDKKNLQDYAAKNPETFLKELESRSGRIGLQGILSSGSMVRPDILTTEIQRASQGGAVGLRELKTGLLAYLSSVRMAERIAQREDLTGAEKYDLARSQGLVKGIEGVDPATAEEQAIKALSKENAGKFTEAITATGSALSQLESMIEQFYSKGIEISRKKIEEATLSLSRGIQNSKLDLVTKKVVDALKEIAALNPEAAAGALLKFANDATGARDQFGRRVNKTQEVLGSLYDQGGALGGNISRQDFIDQIKGYGQNLAVGKTLASAQESLQKTGAGLDIFKDIDPTSEALNAMKNTVQQILETAYDLTKPLSEQTDEVKKTVAAYQDLVNLQEQQNRFFAPRKEQLTKALGFDLISKRVPILGISDELKSAIGGDPSLRRAAVEAGAIPGVSRKRLDGLISGLGGRLDILGGKTNSTEDLFRTISEKAIPTSFEEKTSLISTVSKWISEGINIPVNFLTGVGKGIGNALGFVQGAMSGTRVNRDGEVHRLHHGEVVVPNHLKQFLPKEILDGVPNIGGGTFMQGLASGGNFGHNVNARLLERDRILRSGGILNPMRVYSVSERNRRAEFDRGILPLSVGNFDAAAARVADIDVNPLAQYQGGIVDQGVLKAGSKILNLDSSLSPVEAFKIAKLAGLSVEKDEVLESVYDHPVGKRGWTKEKMRDTVRKSSGTKFMKEHYFEYMLPNYKSGIGNLGGYTIASLRDSLDSTLWNNVTSSPIARLVDAFAMTKTTKEMESGNLRMDGYPWGSSRKQFLEKLRSLGYAGIKHSLLSKDWDGPQGKYVVKKINRFDVIDPSALDMQRELEVSQGNLGGKGSDLFEVMNTGRKYSLPSKDRPRNSSGKFVSGKVGSSSKIESPIEYANIDAMRRQAAEKGLNIISPSEISDLLSSVSTHENSPSYFDVGSKKISLRQTENPHSIFQDLGHENVHRVLDMLKESTGRDYAGEFSKAMWNNDPRHKDFQKRLKELNISDADIALLKTGNVDPTDMKYVAEEMLAEFFGGRLENGRYGISRYQVDAASIKSPHAQRLLLEMLQLEEFQKGLVVSAAANGGANLSGRKLDSILTLFKNSMLQRFGPEAFEELVPGPNEPTMEGKIPQTKGALGAPSKGLFHRSLRGSIGAVVGGAAGFGLGTLLTPLGAIINPVSGGIAGAAIGAGFGSSLAQETYGGLKGKAREYFGGAKDFAANTIFNMKARFSALGPQYGPQNKPEAYPSTDIVPENFKAFSEQYIQSGADRRLATIRRLRPKIEQIKADQARREQIKSVLDENIRGRQVPLYGPEPRPLSANEQILRQNGFNIPGQSVGAAAKANAAAARPILGVEDGEQERLEKIVAQQMEDIRYRRAIEGENNRGISIIRDYSKVVDEQIAAEKAAAKIRMAPLHEFGSQLAQGVGFGLLSSANSYLSGIGPKDNAVSLGLSNLGLPGLGASMLLGGRGDIQIATPMKPGLGNDLLTNVAQAAAFYGGSKITSGVIGSRYGQAAFGRIAPGLSKFAGPVGGAALGALQLGHSSVALMNELVSRDVDSNYSRLGLTARILSEGATGALAGAGVGGALGAGVGGIGAAPGSAVGAGVGFVVGTGMGIGAAVGADTIARESLKNANIDTNQLFRIKKELFPKMSPRQINKMIKDEALKIGKITAEQDKSFDPKKYAAQVLSDPGMQARFLIDTIDDMRAQISAARQPKSSQNTLLSTSSVAQTPFGQKIEDQLRGQYKAFGGDYDFDQKVALAKQHGIDPRDYFLFGFVAPGFQNAGRLGFDSKPFKVNGKDAISISALLTNDELQTSGSFGRTYFTVEEARQLGALRFTKADKSGFHTFHGMKIKPFTNEQALLVGSATPNARLTDIQAHSNASVADTLGSLMDTSSNIDRLIKKHYSTPSHFGPNDFFEQPAGPRLILPRVSGLPTSTSSYSEGATVSNALFGATEIRDMPWDYDPSRRPQYTPSQYLDRWGEPTTLTMGRAGASFSTVPRRYSPINGYNAPFSGTTEMQRLMEALPVAPAEPGVTPRRRPNGDLWTWTSQYGRGEGQMYYHTGGIMDRPTSLQLSPGEMVLKSTDVAKGLVGAIKENLGQKMSSNELPTYRSENTAQQEAKNEQNYKVNAPIEIKIFTDKLSGGSDDIRRQVKEALSMDDILTGLQNAPISIY